MHSTSLTLTLCVLGDRPRAAAAANILASPDSWLALVDLAKEWRVSAPLRERLLELGITPPPEAHQRLDEHVRQTTARSRRVIAYAADVIAALSERGIDTLTLKGVGLIACLYGDPSRRKVADVDLLIDEPHLDRVFETLMAKGLTPVLPMSLSQHRRYLGARSQRSNKSIAFRNAEGLELDLHWRLGERTDAAYPVQYLLSRREHVLLLNQRIAVPAPADAIVQTIHHIVKSDLDLTSLIKDLRDLVAWWELRPEDWSADAVLNSAAPFSLEPAVHACLSLLARFIEAPVLNDSLGVTRARLSALQIERAERMARLMAHRIECGHVNADLVAFYQHGAVARFVSTRILARRTRGPLRAARSATGWVPRWQQQPHTLRRVWNITRDAWRQQAFERSGYRALATVRQQALGE